MTIMQMDEGLDTGPMLHRLTLDIRGKNAGQVTEELAQLGAQALLDWLDKPDSARAAADRRRHLCREDRQGRGADRLEQTGGGDRAPGPRLRALARRLVRS